MDKDVRRLFDNIADCIVEINNRLSVLEAKVANLEKFDSVQDVEIAKLNRKMTDDGK